MEKAGVGGEYGHEDVGRGVISKKSRVGRFYPAFLKLK
jgi:hypothetical protein